MILTKKNFPQQKIQSSRLCDTLKISSKQANPDVLRPWYSTIFNIQKSHFLHGQTFSDIDLIWLLFVVNRARNNYLSI